MLRMKEANIMEFKVIRRSVVGDCESNTVEVLILVSQTRGIAL